MEAPQPLVGLDVFDPSGPTLFISRCMACRATHFPPKDRCPDCFDGVVERVAARGLGSLGAFTHARLSDPELVSPCLVGEVHLSDGPRLYALLVGVETLAAAFVGMPLKLCSAVVRHGQDGDVLGYGFSPAV